MMSELAKALINFDFPTLFLPITNIRLQFVNYLFASYDNS